MKNSRTYAIVTQAACLLFAMLFLYPLGMILVNSFGANGPANYARVFEKVDLLPNFRTSMLVVGGTLLVVAVITSLAAFAFSKIDFRFKNAIYYILLMGMMVPAAATIFPLFQIVKGLKLNNTPLALIMPYATGNTIFNLMVLKNFYDGLPSELIEASTIDGASVFRIFSMVMFPLSIPGLAIVLVQTFLSSWNELQMAMIFINKPALQPLSVVPLRFIQQKGAQFPLEVVYASLVICLLPIAVFFVFAQKLLVQGLTAGAIKG